MMFKRNAPLLSSARRRGSVFIVVAAILAVLGLLTLGLAFTARTETMAARNWTNTVQTREAAATNTPLYSAPAGYGFGTPLRPGENENAGDENDAAGESAILRLHPLDLKIDQKQARAAEPAANAPRRDKTSAKAEATSPAKTEPMESLHIEDASARLNLNAVLPVKEQDFSLSSASAQRRAAPIDGISESMLARFIEMRFEEVGIKNVDPRELAREIAQRRWGADGKPGRTGADDGIANVGRARRFLNTANSAAHDGIDNNNDGRVDEAREGADEASESSSDPRRKPNGDDKPFGSSIELMSLPAMTVQAYRALEPYVTVFSAAYASWEVPDARDDAGRAGGLPQIDPNTASPELIAAALKQRFPSAKDAAIGQFAANMADRRDADDVPTALKFGGKTYYGIEMTPIINEVCPDCATPDEDGDSGEFIELHNPYDRSFSLSGWKLRAGGVEIALAGSLPSGGFLVVTDSFDGSQDAQHRQLESGIGSFYDIYHVVPSGDKRRIVEIPGLNLASGGGKIELLNAQSKLVDVFEYGAAVWDGSAKSLQRGDPRLRAYASSKATPLADNAEYDPQNMRGEALRIQTQWQNQPYAAELETVLTPAAFATVDGDHRVMASSPWAMPGLSSSDSGALNLRLIDCFRVGAKLPQAAPRNASLEKAESTAAAIPAPPSDVTFGRININTAPLALLAAMPGMTSDIMTGISNSRGDVRAAALTPGDQSATLAWQSVDPELGTRWGNLSDFILDEEVWGTRGLYDRLDALYACSKLITTHSLTMIVRNEQTSAPDRPDNSVAVRPSRSRSERVVTADRGRVETIDFRMLGPEGSSEEDPDLRYAQPLQDAKLLLDLDRETGQIADINNKFLSKQ